MTTTIPVHISRYPAPRHVLGAGFDIALHEGAARAARVVPGAKRVCVVVADGAMSTAGSPVAFDLPVAGPSSSCQVWGHEDGAIQVRAAWAPPASTDAAIRSLRSDVLVFLPSCQGASTLKHRYAKAATSRARITQPGRSRNVSLRTVPR